MKSAAAPTALGRRRVILSGGRLAHCTTRYNGALVIAKADRRTGYLLERERVYCISEAITVIQEPDEALHRAVAFLCIVVCRER